MITDHQMFGLMIATSRVYANLVSTKQLNVRAGAARAVPPFAIITSREVDHEVGRCALPSLRILQPVFNETTSLKCIFPWTQPGTAHHADWGRHDVQIGEDMIGQ